MDSILTSVKQLIGIPEDHVHFDKSLIMYINTILAILTQLGIGPQKGFSISDATETWHDFIGDDPRYETVKTYTAIRVRLLFDPPTSSSVTEAYNQMAKECEFRMMIHTDIKNKEEIQNGV